MDDLDRALVAEEPLVPSSGFAARVRDAVEQAAADPPPLPFPWGRFGVAVVATVASAASGLWLLRSVDLSPVVVALSGIGTELGYALATILVTLAVLYAPQWRMTVRRLALRQPALPRGGAPWTTPRA